MGSYAEIEESDCDTSPPSMWRWTGLAALTWTLAMLLAWVVTDEHERSLRNSQFSSAANELVGEFRSRLQRCEKLMLTAAAWAEHGPVHEAARWTDLGRRMGFEQEDWCLDTLSWYPRVEHGAKATFTAEQRASVSPTFEIIPPGERPEYYPISRVTPDTERSRRFLGIDAWADPKRQPLLREAARTGEVRMSGIESFGPSSRAALRYAAVGPVDDKGRPKAFIGAPLRLDLLLAAVTGKANGLDMSVRDLGDGPQPIVVHSLANANPTEDLVAEHRVEQAGRRLLVRVTASQGWGEPAAVRVSTWVVASGTLLGLLATWLVAILERSEFRARRLAHEYSDLARQETQTARRAELVSRTLLEAVPVGVIHVSVDHRVVAANHAAHALLGYEPGTLAGTHLSVMHDAEEIERRCSELSRTLGRPVRPGRALFESRLDEDGMKIEQEWTLVRRDGERFAASVDAVAMETADGTELGSVRIIADISARKRALEDMRYRALHDPLTGLANRTQLEQWVQREVQRAAANRQSFAVMVIDLDRFKQINDTHGHDIGDEVLREVARRLRSGLRPADAVARMGGDEFVVVLASPTLPAEALRIADRLLAAFSADMEFEKASLRVTPSVGIALFPANGTTLDVLIKAADHAMYRAKKAGRNRLAIAGAAAPDS